MKVALFSAKSYDIEYFDHAKKRYNHEITYFESRLRVRTANLTKGFNSVCIFVNDKLDAETIEMIAQNGIKVIALRCAGFNNVDLQKAREMGIKVYRVPAYSPEAVAEHALALILTLNRKTHKAFNRIREANFSLERLTGFNLIGKTVGVIGTGKIGAAFSKIMLGMGCRVIAFDKYINEELVQIGVEYMDFELILKQADILSLHCPLNSETHHIINKKALGMMKRGSMLINTSRGGLVNTSDVITSLKNQHLGYLGIDVYEQEEKLFFKDLSESIIQDDVISRLMTFPNVLITAHQAFFTAEALTQIADITLRNLSDYEEGKASLNEIELQPQK